MSFVGTRRALLSKTAAPSVVSAAMRSVPPQSASANPGSTFTTNNYIYTRGREFSTKSVTGLQLVYANIVTCSTLRSTFYNGWQELGSGAAVRVRGGINIGISGSGLNAGGTAAGATWASVAANSVVGSVPGISQFIYKLDNSGASPVFSAVTYGQFTTDGGVISSSTMNGSTVANSQILVPDGYVVISDAGLSVAAYTPYYTQLEELGILQVTLSGITASSGSAILQYSSTPDALWRVGGYINISGATGNTTLNGFFKITAIDRVGNTITVTDSTITSGAVGGTLIAKATRLQGSVSALITTMAFGDVQKSSATQLDLVGKTDWSSIVNAAADGAILGGFAAILGTDPTGSKNTFLNGDSITYGVGDRSTNAPSGNVFEGDTYGGLGWARRACNAAGYPTINAAVAGMKAQNGVQNGDDLFKRWLASLCDGMIAAMGHNDSTNAGAYVPTWNANYRAKLRSGSGTPLVQYTYPPTSTVGTSANWSLSPRSLQSQSTLPQWVYPGGYFYATAIPAIRALSWNNTAFIDVEAMCGNLDGTATIDGYWPVDGSTQYLYTVDGTHPSRSGHSGIASQIPASMLRALLGY